VRVTRCPGAVESPAFVVPGPTIAVLAGSRSRISITIPSPDQTRLLNTQTGTPDGIHCDELGRFAQKVVLDRRHPNPGTELSGTGRESLHVEFDTDEVD